MPFTFPDRAIGRSLKEVMTLNSTNTLVANGSSLLQKIINQQNLNNRFLAPFGASSLPEKNSTTIFF